MNMSASNEGATLADGVHLQRNGRLEQARDCYQSVLINNPSNIDALFLLGLVRMQSDPGIASFRWTSRAVMLDPGNRQAAAAFEQNFYMATNHCIAVYSKADFVGAAHGFLELVQRHPDYLREVMTRNLYKVADACLTHGQTLLGVRCLLVARCRKDLPYLQDLLNRIGLADLYDRVVWAILGTSTETTFALTWLMSPHARNADPALLQAMMFFLVGAYRSCLAWLHQVRERSLSEYHLLFAHVLRETGDYSYSERAADALRIDPANADVIQFILRQHLVLDAYEPALRWAERLGRLRPNDYDAALWAATSALLHRADDVLERWLKAAVAIDPERPEAYLVKAARDRDGDPRDLFECYKKALRATPRLPPTDVIAEAFRGYCTTAAKLAMKPSRHASTGSGSRRRIDAARLTALHTVPDDGQFHRRDQSGKVRSLRLGPPEVEPLRLPTNFFPPLHRDRFLKSIMVNSYRDLYGFYEWHRSHPFPGYFGTDGIFLTEVEDASIRNGFVFSGETEFVENAARLDEIALESVTLEQPVSVREKATPEDVFSIEVDGPVVRVEGPCAWLGGFHCTTRMMHYFVWLADIAPKLKFFLSRAETKDISIVISKNAYRMPYVRQTLTAIGVPKERLIIIGKACVSFATLYLVESDTRIHTPSNFDWMRARLFEAYGVTPQPVRGKRYYLSRGDAPGRRLLNEPALIEALAGLGFVKIESTPLSLEERVVLFSQAEAIVGINGAGMANILFASTETKVVEIFSGSFVDPLYWMIASHLGMDYNIVTDGNATMNGDFTASVEVVLKLCASLVSS